MRPSFPARPERRRVTKWTVATFCVAGVLLLADAYLGQGGSLHSLRLATDLAVLGLTWNVAIECRLGRVLRPFGLACLVAAGSFALVAFPTSESDPPYSDVPGVLEGASLLVLWALACRHLPYWQLPLFGVLDLAALMALFTRDSVLSKQTGPGGGVVLLLPWLLLLIGVFAVYQRFQAGRRVLAAEQARQSERLELARDLHDHVTHYVTAIVVQAQAGQETGDSDTGRKLFANIERTGQDGLVAMNRMVRLLRDREAAPEMHATRGIGVVRQRVDEFVLTGCSVHVELPDELEAASWPQELIKSVERLVQEGLTNVRKHARAATRVEVLVAAVGDRVTVRVRDNGARGGLGRFRPSGFGMIGLSERVTELGGELTSGARPEGGWELAASIPRRQGLA
ncbi:sensor histidine kinase [Saccharopolyspora elongata]|uniref:sensor histidine kinase n=1 Tax=Saccharopolyspora elongata TaxID=2530387 RepID=UPI00140463E1|nr:histidine kinase [Saccharopolyspora elongata]